MNSRAKKGSVAARLTKWGYIFFAPFGLLYAVFFLFPTCYSFVISMFRYKVGADRTFIGLENYIYLFTDDPYFLMSLKNTVIITIFVLPICICGGCVLAELIFSSCFSNRAKSFLQTANFLPYLTAPVAVAILFSLLFDQKVGVMNALLVKIGLLEQPINWMMADNWMQWLLIIVMVSWEWIGYYMLMYLAGMAGISSDLYEAAKVDGASRWQIFFMITVPLLKNVTTFLVITGLINCLQLYDQPLLLAKGTNSAPLKTLEQPLMTVMTNFFQKGIAEGNYGYGASIMFTLFIIIAVIVTVGLGIMRKVGSSDGD